MYENLYQYLHKLSTIKGILIFTVPIGVDGIFLLLLIYTVIYRRCAFVAQLATLALSLMLAFSVLSKSEHVAYFFLTDVMPVVT